MELLGEGNFRLGDVKEVKITEDFASLDETTKGCQTETSFEDCVTNISLGTLVNTCNCIPYSLKNYSDDEEKVGTYNLTNALQYHLNYMLLN